MIPNILRGDLPTGYPASTRYDPDIQKLAAAR